MKKEIIVQRFPNEMSEYFYFKWPHNLWSLGGEVQSARVDDFKWHLNYPFWATSPPHSIFDLSPNTVLIEPEKYQNHMRRIEFAKTEYPLSVAVFNDLPVILDGLHRLASLMLASKPTLQYAIVEKEELLPINEKL